MRRALPVLVALLVLSAGCSGLLPGGSNETPAGDPGQNGSNGTTDGSAIKAETLAAIGEVETYRVRANVTSQYSGRLDQTVSGTSDGQFNRTAREARISQNQSALGQSYAVETYYVNDTLYQRSDSYTLQFDSEWIRYPAASSASEQWSRFDTLARQRAILNASNVTLDGTETVDGTEAYVLRATTNSSRFEELGFGAGRPGQRGLNVTELNATFYVSTETYRPIRSVTNLVGQTTVQAQGNQRALRIRQRIALEFGSYGESVTVTLPEGADDAVAIGNGTSNASTPA
jgi:hypothetical protein